MILYVDNRNLPPLSVWHVLQPWMNPRPEDFDRLYFKIGDTVYQVWDKDFEAALVWEKLHRD